METRSFVLTDPATYEGDPYEVAERAIRQCAALAGMLAVCLEAAIVMARNAEMERNLYFHADPKAADWETSPQGKMLAARLNDAAAAEKQLEGLTKAAAFNPKNAR